MPKQEQKSKNKKRKERGMNLCPLGTIATLVETVRARVKYNMESGASKFCSNWTLVDTGILVSCGWVMLPIWMAWGHS